VQRILDQARLGSPVVGHAGNARTLRDDPGLDDSVNRTNTTTVMRRTVTFLAVGLVLYAAVSGWSLQRWMLGGGPGERELYVKLPLQQPRFHWYFRDEPHCSVARSRSRSMVQAVATPR
jgi:hypothetical protein